MPFYPYLIETATPDKTRDRLIAKHQRLVSSNCTKISMDLLSIAPIPESAFERRAEGYTKILSELLTHVPASWWNQATKALKAAGEQQLASDPASLPVPFRVVCDAGIAFAIPGYLSYLDLIGVTDTPAFRAKGAERVEYAIYQMEVQFNLSEQWLEWAKKGFPKPDGKLDIGDEWDGWTPPPTTIKRVWDKAPEGEEYKK